MPIAVSADPLDAVFGALAHPVRRKLMTTLMAGARSITALAGPHDMTLPALSRHVRVLEDAGVIARTRSGREHICRLDASTVSAAAEWLDQYRAFWTFQMDRLEVFLESDQETPCPTAKRSRSSYGATSRRRRPRSSTPGRRRRS